jgi:hypothetical protein
MPGGVVRLATARIGGLLALLITATKFGVSSGVGFLALFGVSVQTGAMMVEYINQLRSRRYTIQDCRHGRSRSKASPCYASPCYASPYYDGRLPAAEMKNLCDKRICTR